MQEVLIDEGGGRGGDICQIDSGSREESEINHKSGFGDICFYCSKYQAFAHGDQAR